MPSTFFKDPAANLDYGVDWSAELADGDTISASTWDVPAGLAKGLTAVVAGQAVVWLSGGTLGEIYEVVNRVTTAQGRIDERTITIKIRNR